MENEGEKEAELHDSPHIPNLKMRSNLSERLKASSRSFSSPFYGALSPQLSSISHLKRENTDNLTADSLVEISLLSEKDLELCNDPRLLQKMQLSLRKRLSENEEKLRKLELVEHYHLKNKPEELEILIEKWLTASQVSLRMLYDKLPDDNKSSFQELLNMLNIDKNIVRYDADTDTFSEV